MGKKSKITAIITVAVLLVLMSSAIYIAVSAAPGDSSDPIVTKSYLDSVKNDLQSQIDSLNSSDPSPIDEEAVKEIVDQALQDFAAGLTTNYQKVTVSSGKQLIGGEGAQFIIKSGVAYCTAPTASTGVYNLSNVRVVLKDEKVPVLSSIICMNTGTGIKAETDCVVFIQGDYEIK